MNTYLKLFMWLFIVYIAFQIGRSYGYSEGFGSVNISTAKIETPIGSLTKPEPLK